VRIASEYDRQERQARAAVWAGVGLLLLTLGFALLVRYRPDLASLVLPIRGTLPLAHEESAELAGPVHETAPGRVAPGPEADSGADARHSVPDTSSPPMLALVQDTGGRARTRGRRPVITDVVLLPCSMPNPRADGSIVIPPHNPRHRTVVGLPTKPGEPPRGFVVPPHDPGRENEVPIEIIPMDSILAHTLRVPPHDPTAYSVVRPDSASCLPDSSAAQPGP
jgi:hypothetical protein